jgi:signal transduction histidine kinase
MTADDPEAVPIDVFPHPVLRYTLADGRRAVAATNESFEAAFGDAVTATGVESLLSKLSAKGDEQLEVERIVNGDGVTATLDTRNGTQTYRLQGRGDEGSGLFVVFSPEATEQSGGEPVGIGTVASALTHDLRNPLDVAKANLRAAEETGDSEYFDAVATAHDRMEQLIQDVLTLARGDDVVRPQPDVDVAEAAADAWAAVETQSADLDCGASLPRVTADPGRLRRVFENLFRNAIEHGHVAGDDADEGVTVTVGALETGGFYVADDGRGIPEAEHDAVFEPGYTGTEQGTGLGLAIVERIVAAHGWEVSLTDTEAGGARFEIRFR